MCVFRRYQIPSTRCIAADARDADPAAQPHQDRLAARPTSLTILVFRPIAAIAMTIKIWTAP